MKQGSLFFLRLLLACSVIAASGPRLAAQDSEPSTEVVVVVNPSNPLTDIKLSLLQKLLLGERSIWGNGLSVKLLLPQGGTTEQEAVLGTVVEMTGTQFKQHWVAKVFRGEATEEPGTFQSHETASGLVSTIPGAIAFVEGATGISPDLKVLKVDGMAPGEKGYPLR